MAALSGSGISFSVSDWHISLVYRNINTANRIKGSINMRVASWKVLPVNTSAVSEVIPSAKQLTCSQGKTVRTPSLTILSTLPCNDYSTSVFDAALF